MQLGPLSRDYNLTWFLKSEVIPVSLLCQKSSFETQTLWGTCSHCLPSTPLDHISSKVMSDMMSIAFSHSTSLDAVRNGEGRNNNSEHNVIAGIFFNETWLGRWKEKIQYCCSWWWQHMPHKLMLGPECLGVLPPSFSNILTKHISRNVSYNVFYGIYNSVIFSWHHYYHAINAITATWESEVCTTK